jgi:prolyl oligopeptidase
MLTVGILFFLLLSQLYSQTTDDPYLWLEDIEGEEQLAWVESHNEKTLDYVTNIEGYQDRYDFTYKVVTSNDRLPLPTIHMDRIYNFWQDDKNPRGVWRRTSYNDYIEMNDKWEVLLDIDELCASENTQWSFDYADFLYDNDSICTVELSLGGSDAVEIREFDLFKKEFVTGGFFVGKAKTGFKWIDKNTVYVSTDFGEGSLTNSGYSRILKKWKRGTPMAEAETILEIPEEDMGIWPIVLNTPQQKREMIIHYKSFYDKELYYLQENKPVKLDLPENFQFDIFKDMIIVNPLADWKLGEDTIEKGTVVGMNLKAFLDNDTEYLILLENKPECSVEDIEVTSESVLINTIKNIQSELLSFEYSGGEWVSEVVDLPKNGLIVIEETDRNRPDYFVTYESPLHPTSLFVVKGAGAEPEKLMSLPDYFDSEDMLVRQYWAESKDGTKIPYFIMHKKGLAYDGNNPVIQYGYGGFQISETPYYSGSRGKSWLKDGGIFVIANIRGGGEFGPDWHQAAIKENKQKSYDDFIAVTEDIIRRNISRPEKIGIYGGSNGGLLVGAVMVQRPDLYKAVACLVPLLDMKRYSELLAGNSWIAEYGDPEIPEEWDYIKKYSPYQNVKEGQDYPVVIFLTSTRDDRVHPGHARKMTAKMEEMGYEVYLFENTEGGHGVSYTPDHIARLTAIYFSFFHDQLME